MLVSLQWLKELVDIQLTPEQLAAVFNLQILEVETMQAKGQDIKDVIVAQIKEVQKHPNADKLNVLKVDTGTEVLQIVCGASNVAVGKKIALGLVGAELPGGLKLKRAKIRDVESCGMCCSEKELGLAAESEGILHLPEDAPLGKNFVEYFNLADVVYDLSILPNRGDLQSMRSVAIEVHAATGAALRLPEIKKNITAGSQKKTAITIQDTAGCSRYMGALLTVAVKPSPEWLVRKLQSVGIRSINNVVDITNFVLHELGQPLHAFDHDLLANGQIVVRKAQAGEKIVTLDDAELTLTPDMLVIADADKPVAVAGVMGGRDSAVSEKTKTILLEAACFEPGLIRKTSRATALRTDSSARFEKGISYDGVSDGFYRAIELFQALADGVVVSDLADHAPIKPAPVVITFRPARANQLLGSNFSAQEMVAILQRLQFVVTPQSDAYQVIVPSGRGADIYREVDLIEEIARIAGYDRIPSTAPRVVHSGVVDTKRQVVESLVRSIVRAHGLNETMSYSMTSPDCYKKLGVTQELQNIITVQNPLSVEESVLRQSLLPQLLQAVRYNLDQGQDSVALFEVGKVYTTQKETTKLAGVIYGELQQGVLQKSARRSVDFYDVKGLIENITTACGLKLKTPQRAAHILLHPGKAMEFKMLLTMGEVSPVVTHALGISGAVYAFEIDLDQLIVMTNFKRVYKDIPQFPSSSRDTAFVIDKAIAADEVEKVIRQACGDIVENVKIFDYYDGQPIPDGKVSLAYSITYRALDRTLKDTEVQAAHDKILTALTGKLNVAFR